jgi:hypothetical protein
MVAELVIALDTSNRIKDVAVRVGTLAVTLHRGSLWRKDRVRLPDGGGHIVLLHVAYGCDVNSHAISDPT